MKTDELVRIALSNLWHTKLRTLLTTLGVVIGIGALVAMMSFGTGMQKNITETFEANDLFTSMQVFPEKVNIEDAMHGNPEAIIRQMDQNGRVLNDSALARIRRLNGVATAFPEISFPVKIRFNGKECRTTLRGLPPDMVKFKPYSDIPHGRFFENESEKSVLVSPALLKNLKIRLIEPGQSRKLSLEDTLRGMKSMRPDSILGKEIEIVTSVVDISGLLRDPFAAFSYSRGVPLQEKTTKLKIIGIEKGTNNFNGPARDRGISVPLKTARQIPQLGFSSVWETLKRKGPSKGYSSLHVRLKRMSDLDPVKKEIEDMGFGTLAMADQLQEIKKGFIIFDTALGAVGTIALIVAALGIINTMVMSILERTREIGIMKAVGGSENEIKGIFFVEAGVIGILGGIFGLLLGWIVTKIADFIANHYAAQQGATAHINFFYIPSWLIFGALAFSILISLLAGLYPAIRAARVNPVEALRHD